MQDPSGNTILDVLIIGAGFSGVGAGIKLREKGQTNFRIVEKSQGIGGTWWDNTYPGAACDVPSHFYCYSFEPNPNWSRMFSPQPEIQQYVEHCVDKYDVRPHMEFGRKVKELRLQKDSGLWVATFEDGDTLAARHVINAIGGLHEPSWPDIPGKEKFRGDSMHTARWNHDVDFAGKRIAVIGSAASAIQLIPEVAKVAEHVTVFQRTPNYILPRMDREYTDSEKQRFARWPWLLRLYRYYIFMRLDVLLFPITRKRSWYARRVTSKVTDYMRGTVKDESLHQHLVPDYRLGCKRILISDDLYQTFNRNNVTVVPAAVREMDETGVITVEDQHVDADIIVFATGYDIEAHMRSIDVFGENGQSLMDVWEDGPEAYNGICVAGFPNYYMVTGPNTGVGTTSVVFMIEQSLGYIMKLIERAGRGQHIGVRHEPLARYNQEIHDELGQTVWASGCKSWYRREDGKIIILYPNNARTFRDQLKDVRIDDFELKPATGGN